MPETPTTRLALYKPLNNGSELVNVTQDLNNNWDKVDTAAGFQIVTSGTRPAAPYPGKPITESDTSYRTYFSNGTAPASASWVEIPNSSGTFGSDLKLSSTAKVVWGGDTNLYRSAADTLTTDDTVRVNRPNASDNAFLGMLASDTFARLTITADGYHSWGPGGGSAGDTTLYRWGANVLGTDDDFAIVVAGKGLRIKEGTNAKMGRSTLVGGTVVVATTAVTANSEIFLTCQTPGGTPGFLRVSARTAGTSFTILSSSGTDTSVVAWMIIDPA